jgi:hypothetical protein
MGVDGAPNVADYTLSGLHRDGAGFRLFAADGVFLIFKAINTPIIVK